MAEFNVEFHSLPETFDLDFNGDQAFSLDMELPIVEVTPEDNVFVVTLSWDDDFLPEGADEPGAWVPDQTWAEIKAAGDAGKEITVTASNDFYLTIPAAGHYYSESEPPNELTYAVISYADDKMIEYDYSISGTGIFLYGYGAAIYPNFDSPSRTYTPSDQVQTETITYDPNNYYNGIEQVSITVNAMPTGTAGTPVVTKAKIGQNTMQVRPKVTNVSGYINGGTIVGDPVTVDAYEVVKGTYTVDSSGTKDVTNYASASVPAGTEGTPTATKGAVSNHAITVTPSVTNAAGYISGGTKTGTAVSVSASELDSGSKSISSNGNNIDVVGYAAVDVAVSPTVDDLSITPSESAQTFLASTYNLDGFDEVNVSAVSADYVGSNIPRRYYADLTATGLTVSVPAGYYPNSVGKNVASGTAGTPTATKGAVSNHSVDVTPSVTNTTGYIAGGTKTGTSVTVTASELASGDKAITSNGNNIDVVGYETVSVNVPGGGGASMNVQVAAGVNRVNTTSYTAITGQSITVATTGTYDVYWTGYRSSTSGTNGTQLYIDNAAYGTAQTTFSNNGQAVHLTGVSLTKDQVITLRARARTTSYYMYGGNLTIVQTA